MGPITFLMTHSETQAAFLSERKISVVFNNTWCNNQKYASNKTIVRISEMANFSKNLPNRNKTAVCRSGIQLRISGKLSQC